MSLPPFSSSRRATYKATCFGSRPCLNDKIRLPSLHLWTWPHLLKKPRAAFVCHTCAVSRAQLGMPKKTFVKSGTSHRMILFYSLLQKLWAYSLATSTAATNKSSSAFCVPSSFWSLPLCTAHCIHPARNYTSLQLQPPFSSQLL